MGFYGKIFGPIGKRVPDEGHTSVSSIDSSDEQQLSGARVPAELYGCMEEQDSPKLSGS
jgi:hypothetical protein